MPVQDTWLRGQGECSESDTRGVVGAVGAAPTRLAARRAGLLSPHAKLVFLPVLHFPRCQHCGEPVPCDTAPTPRCSQVGAKPGPSFWCPQNQAVTPFFPSFSILVGAIWEHWWEISW